MINSYLNSKDQLIRLDHFDLFVIQQNNVTGTYIGDSEYGQNFGFFVEYFSKEVYAKEFLKWINENSTKGNHQEFLKWLNSNNSTKYKFKDIFEKVEPIKQDEEIDLLSQHLN